MDDFITERKHDKQGKDLPMALPNNFCDGCEYYQENIGAACGCGCGDTCTLTGDRPYRTMFTNNCVR